MKRAYLLLVFFFSIAIHQAYAQPTFAFSPETQVVNQNDQVCLSLLVEDFTDILSVRFSINWDPGVLQFQNIMVNGSVTGLGPGDFNTSMANQGKISFNWNNGQACNNATSGVTLNDGATLFQICFIATGIYGNHTPVKITDDPQEMYVTRLNANCNDIGQFLKCGFVSIGTAPLTINISSSDGFTNDIVCLDFKVEDFDNIIAFQFAIKWDSSVLEFQNVMPAALPNFNQNNFGTTQISSGILNVSWNTTSLIGATLADGTQIIQVCFKVIGLCGQSSPVYISDNPPAPIEIVNTTAGQAGGTDIGVLQQEGLVTVNCFNPDGITLNIDEKNVCPGESFTIDVKVSDYTNIAKLQFNLKWNPNVIQLLNPKISYPQSGGCFLFNSSVNTTQSGNGLIQINWNSVSLGCTLPNNFILMRLHFKAVGASGSNSTIAVVNPILVDKFGGLVENIGINNNNGLVSVCQLAGLSMAASSADANPGDTVCISFTAYDFDDITKMNYTISWEPNVLQYIGVQDFALAGLSASNFIDDQALTLGVLGVNWANATGITKPDGSKIYKVCFKVIGDPNECSSISFEDIPYPIDIQTLSSNSTNVGLNGQPGQVCTLNPLSFATAIPEVFSGPGASVCLDVTVQNFTQLTSMQYSINWQPALLQFDSIKFTGNLPNFTSGSYNDAIVLTQNGQLVIEWQAANQIIGTTVPDGTSIFQICFTVVGDESDCSAVSITSFPTPIEINSAPTGESNLGLTPDQGSVCVSASLNLLQANITDVDCPSSATGAISISVAGGSGNYSFNWTGPGVQPTAQNQSGLLNGQYAVTVTDMENPALFMNKQFEVKLTPNAPLANAGQDTTFACDNFFLVLNGSGSSSGSNITYLWQSVGANGLPPGSGLVLPGEADKMNPKVIGGESYKLTVTNSVNGCSTTDIVKIAAPQIPHAEAGDDKLVTCAQDTVMLDGSESTFGFEINWTTDNNGHIVPGTENNLTPLVTKSAWYFITLSKTQTGCSKTDSVWVDADIVKPVAFAGVDTLLGCNDPSVPVNGTGSSMGADYTYAWTPVANGEICGPLFSLQTSVCAPGMYQLEVTSTINGCTATDVVQVMGDTLKPNIDAGVDKMITCTLPQASLNGVVTSGSGSYTYAWSPGASIVSGQGTLNAVVNTAGTYTLEVTDDANGCKAFSEAIVSVNKTQPDAVASADGPITCNDGNALLSGTGSSSGANFSYQWKNAAGATIGTNLTATVTTPGNYSFLVINSQNGCSDTATVVVDNLTTPPTASAGLDKIIGCNPPNVTLAGSTGAGSLTIQWSGPVGCISSGGNSPTPTVTCPGMYIMTVSDNATSCVKKDTAMVANDITPPPANAGPDTMLTCATTSIVLQGSSSPSNVTAAWVSVPAGLPVSPATSFKPTITQPGTYYLTVTSTLNGCTKQDFTVVGLDTVKAVANAGMDGSSDCANPLGNLSASGSTLTGTTLTWAAAPGTGTPTINPAIIHDVNIGVPAGTYELTVVNNTNGCISKDKAAVKDNAILPAANAGNDAPIGCIDNNVTLTGSGSTGAGITYLWTSAGGMVLGNDLSLQVTAPGAYIFTVLNSDNSCEKSDTIVVTQSASGPPADAMADGDPCAIEAMLIGNTPDGATGVWTSLTGAAIPSPAVATTLATNLVTGNNLFVWTLTLGNCINYSSDTVTVTVDQAKPVAKADQATLSPGQDGTISLNVLSNDVFGSGGVLFKVLSQPLFGALLASSDGAIVFKKEKCQSGEFEIPYEICSIGCPDLCDTTSISLVIEPDPSENCDEVANGITPNGDGVNDELVFNILLNNPENAFPDNEIIIFNRWGDIVYQARPYLNDWRGTNANGKDLPQATYYYILRLNIANGEIIRGDVTILK